LSRGRVLVETAQPAGGDHKGAQRTALIETLLCLFGHLLSVTRQSTNLFHEKGGKDGLSVAGWDFIGRMPP
jgi:hypothetical protein